MDFSSSHILWLYACKSETIYNIIVSLYIVRRQHNNNFYLEQIEGFEPTVQEFATPRLTTWLYLHILVSLIGLKPMTYGVETHCSIQLSYNDIFLNNGGERGELNPPTLFTRNCFQNSVTANCKPLQIKQNAQDTYQ